MRALEVAQTEMGSPVWAESRVGDGAQHLGRGKPEGAGQPLPPLWFSSMVLAVSASDPPISL